MNVKELRKRASELEIPGRSKMSTEELRVAVEVAERLVEPSKMTGIPMDLHRRIEIYRRQSGSYRQTSKQRRRLAKKARKTYL